MDNLETIMQDKGLVKEAVKEYLARYYCPYEFDLTIPFRKCIGAKRFSADVCLYCWDQALKNQD